MLVNAHEGFEAAYPLEQRFEAPLLSPHFNITNSPLFGSLPTEVTVTVCPLRANVGETEMLLNVGGALPLHWPLPELQTYWQFVSAYWHAPPEHEAV